MTPNQFDALAKLLRLRASPSHDAARKVFVEGLSTADAARATGISYPAAYRVVTRCKAGIELAKKIDGKRY